MFVVQASTPSLMLPTSDHISGQDLTTSMKTILSLVLSILASIGAAALRVYGGSECFYAILLMPIQGALTELWDELFGVRPHYSVYIGSTDAIILGELIQGI